ncbi:CbiQ family ECF transporter T component [soil metagenome]
MLGNYRAGTTLLHRIPAGPKIALLGAYGIVTVFYNGPVSAGVFLAFSIVLVVWAGMPLLATLRALKPLILVIVILGGFQVWQRGWPTALHVVGDMLALFIAALVFTATTPISDMLDAIVRGLGPFLRVGVKPDSVALAFALMIRAVPGTLEIAHETRAAAKARGLERNPRALLVPMAIRTVARAYETGDALAARGIGED